jgi:ABC-type glycerol-3-phosphate transport system substrate-binding protein
MQVSNGDKVDATIDTPAAKQALTMLHQMRWDDNAMGANFLYDWSGINQDFAAGKIGMYMGGSDVYTSLFQQNNIKPADYGLAVLPLAPGSDAGLLGGGTLAAVNVKASPEEKVAAAKWIDFYYIQKYTNQDAAVLDAKTLADSKQPVGVPELPIFDKATESQYDTWIKPYVNVPVDQMSSFTNGIFGQALAGEPASHTQDMYAALDAVVQAVLTNKDADIDALLKGADGDVQAILDQG